MRISDWSSDVCSSDLIAFEANVFVSGLMIEMDRAHGLLRMTSRSSAVVEGAHAKTLKPQALHVDIGVEDVSLVTETFRLGEFVAELVDHALSVDRKSVVSGKSVSVRVDIGGRRDLKKKKKKKNK